MSGTDIKSIVDYLKGPPFHRSESLVDFSKKSPVELLQVVNDVFAEIDSQQKKDIREEQKEQTAIRMLEFVTVLGYRIEGDMSVECGRDIQGDGGRRRTNWFNHALIQARSCLNVLSIAFCSF